MSAYLVVFPLLLARRGFVLFATSMTLMEQTEKAELLLSTPSPRRQSKKAELLPGTIQAVFLSKTTKEPNCHCSSRVLEQKLEMKKLSLSKPCPCQENKEAKKKP